jgi:hypothetical protein
MARFNNDQQLSISTLDHKSQALRLFRQALPNVGRLALALLDTVMILFTVDVCALEILQDDTNELTGRNICLGTLAASFDGSIRYPRKFGRHQTSGNYPSIEAKGSHVSMVRDHQIFSEAMLI